MTGSIQKHFVKCAPGSSVIVAQTYRRGLENRLVSPSPQPRHNPDASWLVNVLGHNTNLALARLNDPGAVRPDFD
jgi:hypothetical protein